MGYRHERGGGLPAWGVLRRLMRQFGPGLLAADCRV
jgi:hypothetical protein